MVYLNREMYSMKLLHTFFLCLMVPFSIVCYKLISFLLFYFIFMLCPKFSCLLWQFQLFLMLCLYTFAICRSVLFIVMVLLYETLSRNNYNVSVFFLLVLLLSSALMQLENEKNMNMYKVFS